jgi:hypothetical protein
VRNIAACRFVLSSFSFPCAQVRRVMLLTCSDGLDIGKLEAISSSLLVRVCEEQISEVGTSTHCNKMGF